MDGNAVEDLKATKDFLATTGLGSHMEREIGSFVARYCQAMGGSQLELARALVSVLHAYGGYEGQRLKTDGGYADD